MLDIPQGRKQPLQPRNFQPEISIMLRFKNPDFKGTNSTSPVCELQFPWTKAPQEASYLDPSSWHTRISNPGPE